MKLPLSVPDVELDLQPMNSAQVLSGTPSSGSSVVRTYDGAEVGVWAMTPGTVSDVEEDEIFVVLAGAASIRFEDGRVVEVRAGQVMELLKGQRTEWTVTETLRKVYVIAR